MKLKINKFQEGGGMPYVVYQPTPSLISDTTDKNSGKSEIYESKKNSSDESNSSNLLSKEIINELIKKGLPNDVNLFLKELQNAESSTFDGSFDRNKLYSLSSKANQIIHNSGLMDSALKEAYNNDGLEELAIGTRGQLFVQDKSGNIKQISMSDYSKKRDNYLALTVNDLSKARMYNPNLAFDTEIISTIQNSLGINKVNDYMMGIISKLGTESITKEGYIDKNALKETLQQLGATKNLTDNELKGMKELMSTYQSMGKEGIYKVTTEQSSQRNHISDAFNYLWSLLPNNARNVLKARYIVDGNEYANPVNIIQNSFMKFTNESSKTNMDYSDTMNKEDGNNSKEKQYNQSPLEKLVNADLDVQNIPLYNSDNSDYGLNLKGSVIGQLPGLDGKPINKAPLGIAIDNSIGSVIDKNKIFFGNKKVEGYDLNNIIYSGEFAANTWIPIDSQGNPNFRLLEDFQNALSYIKKNNISNISEMNKIMKEEFNLPQIQFDNQGNISQMSKQYLKPFIVIHGYTTNGIDPADNNILSHTISNEKEDGFEKEMKSLMDKYKLPFTKGGGLFGIGSKMIQAPIFIGLSPSATNDAATFSNHGSLINQQTVSQDMMRENKIQVPVSSDLLYQ